jgi:hypothetical protein
VHREQVLNLTHKADMSLKDVILSSCGVFFLMGAANSTAAPSIPENFKKKHQRVLNYCKNNRQADGAWYADKHTLCIKGDLSKVNFGHLRSNINSIKYVVLDSGGGGVLSFIKMATMLIDLKFDIIVDGICLSSCANYLLPTGSKIYVLKTSVLGWHGGPQKNAPSLWEHLHNIKKKNHFNDYELDQWYEIKENKESVEEYLNTINLSSNAHKAILSKINYKYEGFENYSDLIYVSGAHFKLQADFMHRNKKLYRHSSVFLSPSYEFLRSKYGINIFYEDENTPECRFIKVHDYFRILLISESFNNFSISENNCAKK